MNMATTKVETEELWIEFDNEEVYRIADGEITLNKNTSSLPRKLKIIHNGTTIFLMEDNRILINTLVEAVSEAGTDIIPTGLIGGSDESF